MWSGISTIASALQRKVWIPFGLDNLYPNLYIMLVAPPGRCRKGPPITLAKKMLTEIQSPVFVDSPTKRALTKYMDSLRKTEMYLDPVKGIPVPHCSLALISKELSSFLAVDPKSMIEVLTDLYDSHEEWEYQTAGEGKDTLYRVCVNCFFATTPTWMATNLPEESIGGGFTSRYILVSGKDKYKKVPIPPTPPDALYKELIGDLDRISRLVGEFKWDDEAEQIYRNWYNSIEDQVKETKDERLHGYLERIHIMAIKTAMSLHVAEEDSLIILPKDITTSINLLQRVLDTAGEALGAHGRSEVAIDVDRIMGQLRLLGETPFTELLRMNYRHTDKIELGQILDTIEGMGYIRRTASTSGKITIKWIGIKEAMKKETGI